mmetsp:Transcript_46654/g.92104  ORF Transcript_46654/g.92104 Transcript_46654/m.92104 type:complete len:254 (-) Transcript_46654:739-1500(-)
MEELVAQLMSQSSDGVKENAAGALASHGVNNESGTAIVKAGGVPPLVGLLTSGTDVAKENAARALGKLAVNDENSRKIIAHAGAVPSLETLLNSGTDSAQEHARRVLELLTETQDTSEAPENSKDDLEALALLLLLENGILNSRTASTDVSELAQRKDSYGVAWLMLHYMQKKQIRSPFKSLDLSNAHLSPRKLHLLLSTLPKSTEELKLGRRSFIRCGDVVSQFLGSLGDSGQNGTGSDVASLTSVIEESLA